MTAYGEISMNDRIKVLTFDTGGTVLDWHSGFRDALKRTGEKYGLTKDWADLANKLRKKSMNAMLQLGENSDPEYNFDGAHRFCLEEVLREEGVTDFSDADMHFIAYETPHSFNCWADFPDALERLRKKFLVCSFTILSYRLIMDSARHNQLSWDAVFSCEGIGKYKMLAEPYERVAFFLQVNPENCLMVAAHPWDLNAAKKSGYSTAFVERPSEWGGEKAPWAKSDTITPDSYDIVVKDFSKLADTLGV